MKTFIVEVIDNSKVEFVETLLGEIDGIIVKEKKKIVSRKPAKANKSTRKEKVFAHSFGMWKDTDITIESIRNKAWPKRI
jgi:hypothetical protein